MFDNTFTRRPGTLNLGKENELLNLANLMLKLTIDDAVQDFALSSDDSTLGAFDDIVCEVQTNDKKFAYAIQLKHVNDEEKKKITLEDLQETGKKNKFNLSNFCAEYLKMKDVCEPFDIILHTNRKLDFDAEEEEIVFKHGTNTINVVMTKCDAHPWLSTNTNKCYKFKIIENQDKTIMETYKKFFGKFYMYVEQLNVKKLKEHILDKFKNKFCCENDHVLKKYLDFIESWRNEEKKKQKLSKMVVKNVLVLNLLSENLRQQTTDDTDELVNEKRQVFAEAVRKYDVTIFGKKSENLVKSIWPFDCNELLNDTQAKKLAEDYQLLFNKEAGLKLGWLMGRCPLFVVDRDVTRKAINLSTSKEFVLFSDNDNIDDFEKLSVLRKLSDLEEHPEIYETVVDKFRCAIQLKTNAFPLKTFLEGNKEIQDIVTTDKLVSMIDGPLVICADNEVLPPHYITRSISRNIIIEVKFFEKMDEDTLVLICGWKKNSKLLDGFRTVDVEELLENDEYDEESGRVIYVSDVEGCRKEFDLLCSKVKKPKAHLFAMTEREKLEWVRSTHGVEDLEGFRVEPSSMGESELLRYENNINIVCADSGMGKTELMKSVKNQYCYNYSWTTMIYARNHYQHFKQNKDAVEAFKKYIFDRIYNRYEEFDVKFFKKLIRGTKPIVVRYVWDGLNEVSSEHVKVIMKLIRDLSKEGTKNWITSRTNLKQSLENYFGTFSWTISEFDEDQQQTYIQDRLSHLTDSFKISLNSIRLSWCGGVFGIPLLIYILTEFFSMEHSIPDGSCPIGKLYQHLVDQIFNVHYTEKHDYNIHSECQTERNEVTKNKRILNYEKVAMKMYFEGDVVSKMDVDKFLMKIKSESDHVGIITRVVETESPLFLHSSFAEYFAGSYLARYDPDGDKFDLSGRSYKNIRLFRDLLVKQK